MSATRLLAMTLTSAIALTSSVPLVHAQETPTAAPVKKKVAKKPKSAAPIDPYADAPADAAPSATTLDPYANAAEPATADKSDSTADPYAKAPPATDVVSPTPTATASNEPRVMTPGLLDIVAAQGLLAVEGLDGWLLFDRDGQNPIGASLVAPHGRPHRAWFYWIPAHGDPVALVHTSEQAAFSNFPASVHAYTSHAELVSQLRTIVGVASGGKGKHAGQKSKLVAMEYSPVANLPDMSRVDAGTFELVTSIGATVRSSEHLVSQTKALWGDVGRVAHQVAVHHLTELRRDAVAFIRDRMHAQQPVTEGEVVDRLVAGMAMRGLVGPTPVVSTGAASADPDHVSTPSANSSTPITNGDVVVIQLAGRIPGDNGVFASLSWVAYAGAFVPSKVEQAFDIVALARDQALLFISDRTHHRHAVKGYEVDAAARAFIGKAGFASHVVHRTGHSLDRDLFGGGADLDGFEIKDDRVVVPGTGFTIGPGLYFNGEFGVRAEVSVFFGPDGPEVTTPAQEQVEPLVIQ